MLVSLVIPTLNERDAIPALFDGLAAASRALAPAHALEVVVVDDGSTDGTVGAVRAAAVPFPVRVVERTERGLATAVLRGFAVSRGDAFAVMDADLSHPPEVLPRLVAALSETDVVVGSRHAAGGTVEEWPWYRLWASLAMTLLARPLARVRDPLSGFFLLRRPVVEGVALSPVGYKILLEILVKGRYRSVREIPYTFRNRGVGKSKMGLREGVNFLRHLARLYRWRLAHGRAASHS